MLGLALTGELARAVHPVLVRWPHPGQPAVRRPRRRRPVRHTCLALQPRRHPRADGWVHAARKAVALYGDNPAVPFADWSAEIVTEARKHRRVDRRTRRACTDACDRPPGRRSQQLARSLPGAPAIGGAGADRGLRRGSVAPDSVARCHAKSQRRLPRATDVPSRPPVPPDARRTEATTIVTKIEWRILRTGGLLFPPGVPWVCHASVHRCRRQCCRTGTDSWSSTTRCRSSRPSRGHCSSAGSRSRASAAG